MRSTSIGNAGTSGRRISSGVKRSIAAHMARCCEKTNLPRSPRVRSESVFGFIAQPETHIFLKPNVTRIAAREYGYDFQYVSRPSWETYASVLGFAQTVRQDLRDMPPRDMIDIQSFIWVQGSDEYDE